MIDWWSSVAERWDWAEPMILLGVATALVTALIPVLLWRLGARQTSRDHETRVLQAKTLGRLENIERRRRRDKLVGIVGESEDTTHLELLWADVREYSGRDRDLLQTAFRANVALALPGAGRGRANVGDVLEDDHAVADYVAGFERRFGDKTRPYGAYDGLLDFLVHVRARGLSVDVGAIVALVTGPTAEVQRPGHTFFRELVTILPEAAESLFYGVESIDYRTEGGTRLNVLTGTLLAIKDIELGRVVSRWPMELAVAVKLRASVPTALATLLRRDNLRSLDRWSMEGSTESVSATVAWLIRAVGWFADAGDHVARRMVQNLADAIRSVPESDRGWGIDDEDVREGFQRIRQKQPALWAEYGGALESAASAIGEWRDATSEDRMTASDRRPLAPSPLESK